MKSDSLRRITNDRGETSPAQLADIEKLQNNTAERKKVQQKYVQTEAGREERQRKDGGRIEWGRKECIQNSGEGDSRKIATWKTEKEVGNNIQMNLREMG
jgi:hypothetical protein